MQFCNPRYYEEEAHPPYLAAIRYDLIKFIESEAFNLIKEYPDQVSILNNNLEILNLSGLKDEFGIEISENEFYYWLFFHELGHTYKATVNYHSGVKVTDETGTQEFKDEQERRAKDYGLKLYMEWLKDETGISARDVAKAVPDRGFHAPTTYFPLLVPECLLIEPTETESKETLDAFDTAMSDILKEARDRPQQLKAAPHTTPVRRLDEVKAARELDLASKPG